MKRILILIGMIALFLCLGITVYADEAMKISLNDEVKAAKAVGSGSGISFTLPDVDNKFLINTIELAILEKQEDENEYRIIGESKMVENPTSLNINFGFGDIAKYKERAKYKIAYRYYVEPIEDLSKVLIAGAELKEGWRLVGEVNPNTATEQGFDFYKNTNPSFDIEGICYQAETIEGLSTFQYDLDQIKNIYLPENALQNRVNVKFSATDYDSEDLLSVQYKLFDGITNELLYIGIFDNSKTIYSDIDSSLVKVVLSASDNWGGESTEISFMLNIDKELPTVINQFNDMGRALRGRNLYSKFTITDDQNNVLTNGHVYYAVKQNGDILYSNTRMPNNPNGFYTVDLPNQQDGEYEIILTIFDKGYNKIIHTLKQTLDNTAPVIRFLTPEDNLNVTAYSTWINKSKKIMFTATDVYAGLKKCNQYLNNSIYTSIEHLTYRTEYTYTFNVSSTKTGKLYYHFYVYDNACTVNKTTNVANTTASGNSAFASNYVWLDKTPPSITINANSNTWYSVPANINVDAYDYPSASNVSDNSGVKSKQYCITDNEICDNNWLNYQSRVTFNQGGVYYLHVKAIDFAGNETIETKRIMLNTAAQIISKVKPTDSNAHTIYNERNGMYIIKNTAFHTKYHFILKDDDILDIIQTEVKLVNQDDGEWVSQTSVQNTSNGTSIRDIEFNMPYINSEGEILPDGVYVMYLSISEIKNDGSIIKTAEDVKGCEVIIKRNAPSTPVISVLDGYVMIDYPDEILSNSLNRTDIKALYKREYKAVIDKRLDSNAYKPYVAPIAADDMVVTALYTDMAGNISMATKRIYKESSNNETSIVTEGNTVTIEEGRPANTYYIGIRRDKQAGINNSVFNFLN